MLGRFSNISRINRLSRLPCRENGSSISPRQSYDPGTTCHEILSVRGYWIRPLQRILGYRTARKRRLRKRRGLRVFLILARNRSSTRCACGSLPKRSRRPRYRRRTSRRVEGSQPPMRSPPLRFRLRLRMHRQRIRSSCCGEASAPPRGTG